MAGGSGVIVCAVTFWLVLSCGADRLLNRQRAFETIMTQDMTMLIDKVSKMQENMEIVTQMLNASLQQNGQSPDGSHTDVHDLEGKLSRTTRQLHAAFVNQKMAISNDLARMGETMDEFQKKVLTSEIRMQNIEEKVLGILDNYTKVVGEHLANVTEGYANTMKTQMDDVLLQIHKHTVSVGFLLQGVATRQNIMMQSIKDISSQSETADKCVAGIGAPLRQMTSDVLLAIYRMQHVRLAGGSSTGSGRIEVRHDNQWGTVCDDLFDENNNGATVVCRMFGYTRGVHTKSYGRGSGNIWMDSVACTGREGSILDCPRTQFGEHNCGHSEDVGVDCS